MRISSAALVLVLGVGGFACERPWDTNAHDMVKARDNPKNGTYKSYAGACSTHWKNVVDAVTIVQLNIRSTDEAHGEIIAEAEGEQLTNPQGDLVAVWVEPKGDSACRVRVYARAKSAMLDPKDWDDIVFRALDKIENASRPRGPVTH